MNRKRSQQSSPSLEERGCPQERPLTRVVAGVLGVPGTLIGLAVVVIEPAMWIMWLPSLVGGPVLLFVAVTGRAPRFLAPGEPVDPEEIERWARSEGIRFEPAPWWERLALGLVIGTALGLIDALFSGSLVDGLLGWALPYGILVGLLLLLAPLIERSRFHLTLAGALGGSLAGLISWALVHRHDAAPLLVAVSIGMAMGVVVAWFEMRHALKSWVETQER